MCGGSPGRGGACGGRAVYPRVCGGIGARIRARKNTQGLSPRVRGKPAAAVPGRAAGGSIPACAGEAPAGIAAIVAVAGLSPRVRGKHRRSGRRSPVRRSIPACAGEAVCGRCLLYGPPVYPRVCGGSFVCHRAASSVEGLSPRVRGKRLGETRPPRPRGSIPACAGEAPISIRGVSPEPVYPRVCGGSPVSAALICGMRGLSPRVRGKPDLNPSPNAHRGSIPACAGEASPAASRPAPTPVYPRVCGGSGDGRRWGIPQLGLSPRVRGKLHHPNLDQDR